MDVPDSHSDWQICRSVLQPKLCQSVVSAEYRSHDKGAKALQANFGSRGLLIWQLCNKVQLLEDIHMYGIAVKGQTFWSAPVLTADIDGKLGMPDFKYAKLRICKGLTRVWCWQNQKEVSTIKQLMFVLMSVLTVWRLSFSVESRALACIKSPSARLSIRETFSLGNSGNWLASKASFSSQEIWIRYDH